jgi:O-methyltransferase
MDKLESVIFIQAVNGGYIFIHDYNNINWKGAAMAVRKFFAEFHVPYFPLSDNQGSAIIMK